MKSENLENVQGGKRDIGGGLAPGETIYTPKGWI